MENGSFIVGLPIKWWIFPWQTVSHNQMVVEFLQGPPLADGTPIPKKGASKPCMGLQNGNKGPISQGAPGIFQG